MSGDFLSFIIFGIISLIVFIILLTVGGEKIMPLLMGVLLVFLGVGIIFKPGFYSYLHSYYFDFTGYNIPFGIFMVVVGIFFILTSLRKKKKT